MVLAVGAGSLLFVLLNLKTMILDWAFLSMALRGVTVFAPLVGAVFASGWIKPEAGVRAVVFAPLLAMLWVFFLPEAGDPVFVGMGLSTLILACGFDKMRNAGPGRS